MNWRSRGSDRKPIEVEHTVAPIEPSGADMYLAMLSVRVGEALVVLDAALKSGLLDRRAQDVLFDVRNELVPPLPQRPTARARRSS